MPEVRRRRARGWRRITRRLRRLRQDRTRLAVVSGVLGVLLIGLLWSLWALWSTARDLREVQDQAQIMRAALVRGDAEGARRAMDRYQEAADSAADGTSGPTWWVFEHVPLLGDDASGVAAVSGVLADIGHQGLPPVAEAAEQVTADAFGPRDGTFPLERIAATEKPAQRSERAFDAAARTLAEVDSSGFVGPVADRFDELRTLVDDARATLGSTYRAARLMPTLLGAEQDRDYLLVLQNNAESRSSGGLPGSVSLVRASAGHAEIVKQLDMAALGATAKPVLPLTAEERTVFGDILGRTGVDATLTPDFPRSAELIRARWRQVEGGRVDGVFFVDPVAVSYLMRGTGPIAVPGNAPVTADDVVRKVESDIYLSSPTTTGQSDYQNAVAKAVFQAFSAGRINTAEAIRGLVAGVQEGRVRMHLFLPEAQDEIAGTSIAGEFVGRDPDGPEVGIYVNDGGPTKMQYYLRSEAQLFSRSCLGGRQELGGSVRFTNASPPHPEELPDTVTGEFFPGNRTDPGQQILVVYLTTPVGGELVSLSVDGQRVVRPVVQKYAGREVATLGVLLDPGQVQTVDFVVRGGSGRAGDPALVTSPGAVPGSSNDRAPSSCTRR